MLGNMTGWETWDSRPVSEYEGEVALVVRKNVDGSSTAALMPTGLVPRAVRSASPELLDVFSAMQHTAGEVERLVQVLGDLATDARDLGASWASIGWCVGTSGEAARQRWGLEDSE